MVLPPLDTTPRQPQAKAYLEQHGIVPKLNTAVNAAIASTSPDPCQTMAKSLCGPPTLVLYASNISDRAGFTSIIKGNKIEYDFGGSPKDLIKQIKFAKKHFGPFKAIALAGHAGKDAAAAQGYKWALLSSLVVGDESELLDKEKQETAQLIAVMRALGKAVVPGGRVDLLCCELLATPAGKKLFDTIQVETETHFAASEDITSNVKQGGNWVMESDGTDISPLYFHDGIETYNGKFGWFWASDESSDGGYNVGFSARDD